MGLKFWELNCKRHSWDELIDKVYKIHKHFEIYSQSSFQQVCLQLNKTNWLVSDFPSNIKNPPINFLPFLAALTLKDLFSWWIILPYFAFIHWVLNWPCWRSFYFQFNLSQGHFSLYSESIWIEERNCSEGYCQIMLFYLACWVQWLQFIKTGILVVFKSTIDSSVTSHCTLPIKRFYF